MNFFKWFWLNVILHPFFLMCMIVISALGALFSFLGRYASPYDLEATRPLQISSIVLFASIVGLSYKNYRGEL